MTAPVRPPAVAGRFYPGDPATLAATVDRLLKRVAVPDDDAPGPAYVVPHAGYQYSGPTAAHVYARLRARADRVQRVIIIGPAHYAPVRGAVVAAAPAWLTPLGEVPVDTAAVAALVDGGHAVADDGPLGPEHSLEVQVPFVQRCLAGTPTILPMLIGASTVDEAAAAIRAALAAAGPGAVLLCSTDLSHYERHEVADAQDARTAGAVLDLAADRIGLRDACGVYPLRGLVSHARATGLRPSLLYRCTSAEATGDRGRVVGYAAFAFQSGNDGSPGERSRSRVVAEASTPKRSSP
jgi:AmmeMemoRadiSam system protein B